MTVERRGTWTTRAMKVAVRPRTPYKGAAVHWPGFVFTITDHASCRDLMRDLEDAALNDSYGALPYQVAACQHGRVIEGRTVARVNGANGSDDANREYGSIVALLPVGGTPTDAMLHAIHEAADYLNAKRLLTHNQVRPEATACPGPKLTRWINDGAPDPEEQVDYDKLADAVWSHELANDVTGAKSKAGVLLTKTHAAAKASTEAIVDRIVDLIDDVINRTPGGVTPEAIRVAVNEGLRDVLGSLDN